uniref:Gamma-glutamylcyclotransferase family protein n=1 Tax=Romanomermis culicivorax TaxID=13658 RepID=A0A915HWI6_ROMCU
MTTATHMVFVYGTLKSGEPNHHYLSNSFDEFCKYIGLGQMEKKYPLIIASKYNIPYLLDIVHPDAKV